MTQQQLAQLLAANPEMSDDELVALAQRQRASEPSTLRKVWDAITRPIAGEGGYLGVGLPRVKEPGIPGSLYNTVASFAEAMTSPLDVATLGAGIGARAAGRAGMMGLSKLARAAEVAGTGSYGVAGAAQLPQSQSTPEALANLAQMGMSAWGVRGAMKPYPMKALARNPNAPNWYDEAAPHQVAAHAAEGGSTFNRARGNMAGQDAYAVGGNVTPRVMPEGEFNQQALKQFARDNADLLKDPNKSLGSWADQGQVHLDISDTVDKEKALALMGERGEDAIYGLQSKETLFNPKKMVSPQAVVAPALAATASQMDEEDPTQALIKDFLMLGAGASTVGMAARGFNPKVLKELRERVLQQVKTTFKGQDAKVITSVLEKYKSAGLLGDVLSSESDAGMRMLGRGANASYAMLPDQPTLERTALAMFQKPIGELSADETLALLRQGRRMKTNQQGGMAVNLYNEKVDPSTIEHEMGHLGQDLAKGGLIRDAYTRDVPYPIQPHEVGARVREKKVKARERGERRPDIGYRPPFGKNATREQWVAELDRVQAANKEVYGGPAGLPAEMEKSRQRLMGYKPGNIDDGPLQQVVPSPDVRELVEPVAKKAGSAFEYPAGPFEGIDLRELTDNVADIVKVAGKGKKQTFTLKPKTTQRLDALLNYAKEKSIGADWTDTSWKKFFNSEADADEFARFWAATSPQNPIDRNFTSAIAAYTKHRGGIPAREMGGQLSNFEAWTKNIERVQRGEPISGPKVIEMEGALLGDPNAVPIDTHFMRALGWNNKKSLTEKQHRVLQTAFQQYAREKGMTPFEAMAMVWAAIRDTTGRVADEGFGVKEAFLRTGHAQPSLFTGDPIMRFGPEDMGANAQYLDPDYLLSISRMLTPLKETPVKPPRIVGQRKLAF